MIGNQDHFLTQEGQYHFMKILFSVTGKWYKNHQKNVKQASLKNSIASVYTVFTHYKML